MDTLLQQYLTRLKSAVNEMSGLVEESIVISTKALAKKNTAGLERVFELEDKINEFHKKIDRDCFKLLARQSPVASDLRLLLVCTKMAMDLERMGDLACSMTYSIYDSMKGQPLPVANEIPKMADLVRLMVRKGLNAFIQNDEEEAREVLKIDDSVDGYRDSLSEAIRESMRKSQTNIDGNLELFTIIRNLERIGDHATNIAEEAIFLISGEDIRHESGERELDGPREGNNEF